MKSRIKIIDLILSIICIIGFTITVIDSRWNEYQTLWVVFGIPSFIAWFYPFCLSWSKNTDHVIRSFELRSWRIGTACFIGFLTFGITASIIVQARERFDIWLIVGALAAIISLSRMLVFSIIDVVTTRTDTTTYDTI